MKPIITVLAIGLALYQIWFTGGFGILDSQLHRTLHLGVVLTLVFMYLPPRKLEEGEKEHPFWLMLDLVLIAGAIWSSYFIISDIDYYLERIRYIDPVTDTEALAACVAVVLVLEATRRVAGIPLVIVSVCFLLYALFGNMLPGPLRHEGVSFKMLCEQMYLVTEGLYGIPLAVSSTMIFAFVMFGSFLQNAGLGQVFLDIACVATRRAKGGPAKVSIFASALFGSISGSSVANVYSTGTFTIPLMKRVGYAPHFAGAVEAVSSAGGQLMPPVMGATAFVMADITGAGYLAVATAALLPSILYYFALFMMIHYEAVKFNVGVMPEDQIPDTKSVVRRLYHMIPILILIYFLISGRSVINSAFIAILSILIVSSFSRETRFTFKRLLETLESTSRSALMISACSACAGIIVASVSITGVGYKFISIITDIGQFNMIFLLVLLMLTCFVLGMGVPSTPAYIIVATLGAPALMKLGIPTVAAHLFVLYYAILSEITPPVCLSAYAGASIAKANAMTTGFQAFRLGIVAYIIPFMFVFEPSLLLMGDWPTIIQSIFTAAVGVIALAGGMQGYF
ncbi:MAG: TRAP transporter permease, partial [Mailhella sp.]|nr:TRAP transporter permease [Mailhella sp.]